MIAKSFLGSLRVQRYVVFMRLHDSSASYWTSKNGLPCDLSKMPEAISRWPLLVELQYWLSRLQRVRLPYRPSFRFLLNMKVLILAIFGRFVLECPNCPTSLNIRPANSAWCAPNLHGSVGNAHFSSIGSWGESPFSLEFKAPTGINAIESVLICLASGPLTVLEKPVDIGRLVVT